MKNPNVDKLALLKKITIPGTDLTKNNSKSTSCLRESHSIQQAILLTWEWPVINRIITSRRVVCTKRAKAQKNHNNITTKTRIRINTDYIYPNFYKEEGKMVMRKTDLRGGVGEGARWPRENNKIKARRSC